MTGASVIHRHPSSSQICSLISTQKTFEADCTHKTSMRQLGFAFSRDSISKASPSLVLCFLFTSTNQHLGDEERQTSPQWRATVVPC